MHFCYACSARSSAARITTRAPTSHLCMRRCTTASLPCLAALSQLQSLDASRCCALRDISGLSRCGQLLSLDLTWCWSISSLEPLVGCSRLVRLQLRGVPPDVDLQPLLTVGSDALVVSLA